MANYIYTVPYADLANTASFADSANTANLATYANIANYANSTDTANYAQSANNASYATRAGTVLTNAQPNITSVGTLSNLVVSGFANITNYVNKGTADLGSNSNVRIAGGTAGQVLTTNGSGSLYWSTGGYGDSNVANFLPNYTGILRGSELQLTGNLFANNANITNYVIANIFQGNSANISGNIFANNANVSNLIIADRINTNGNIKSNNTIEAANIFANYMVSNVCNVTQTLNGNNANFANVNVYTKLYAAYIYGDGSNISNVTANYANTAGYTANANYASYAGNAFAVSGSNVTSMVAEANYAEYSNNASFANNATNALYANVANSANSVAGANVTGTVSSANYATTSGSTVTANRAITVTGNAQPNITSVGTLTSLIVSGSTTLSDVSNLTITGGNNGYYLQTDGLGNLSWVSGGGSGNGVVGGSNTQVQFNDGGSFGGSPGLTFDKTSNITYGNFSGRFFGWSTADSQVISANLQSGPNAYTTVNLYDGIIITNTSTNVTANNANSSLYGWRVNFTGSNTTTLDSLMNVGDQIKITWNQLLGNDSNGANVTGTIQHSFSKYFKIDGSLITIVEPNTNYNYQRSYPPPAANLSPTSNRTYWTTFEMYLRKTDSNLWLLTPAQQNMTSTPVYTYTLGI